MVLNRAHHTLTSVDYHRRELVCDVCLDLYLPEWTHNKDRPGYGRDLSFLPVRYRFGGWDHMLQGHDRFDASMDT